MTLGNERFEVAAGDSIVAAPDIAPCLHNLGDGPLRLLCCRAPACSRADTE